MKSFRPRPLPLVLGVICCALPVPSIRAAEPKSLPHYFLFPVTTDLQRQLVDKPADLVVVMNARQGIHGGRISPEDVGLKDLRADLVKQKGRGKILFRLVGATGGAGETLIHYAVLGLAHEIGFTKASASQTSFNDGRQWQDVARTYRLDERPSDATEPATGGDQIKAYPVGTPLSRALSDGSDCVVIIEPAVAGLNEEAWRGIAKAVGGLTLASKGRLNVVVRNIDLPPNEQQKLLAECNRTGESLGFKATAVTFR